MNLSVLSSAELGAILASIALLLCVAFVFGRIFVALGAPKVAGEIAGGFLLAFILQNFAKDLGEAIFFSFKTQGNILNIFYHLGLIFLMFMAGFHTKLNFARQNTAIISALFIGASILPIAFGFAFIEFFYPHFIGAKGDFFSFSILFLIAIAVSSIPVISKIFFDLNLMGTRFASVVLSMATLQDLVLWIFLNIALNHAQDVQNALSKNLITAILTIILFFGIAPFCSFLAKFNNKLNNRFNNRFNEKQSIFELLIYKILNYKISKEGFYLFVFLGLFASIFMLNKLGINPMYSAFLFGFFVKNISRDFEPIKNISEFSFSFFIPLYFALVGLGINLNDGFSFWLFALFFALAFCAEFLGIYIALSFCKIRTICRINFAITLNARGGPGIVLASVGYYYEIINSNFFAVLIFTTLLSSIFAGYFLRFIRNKDIFEKFD